MNSEPVIPNGPNGEPARWRPISGYEDTYEVCDRGFVRRIGPAARAGKGHGGGARIGHCVALCPIRKGYIAVNLWRSGKIKRYLLHVLVASSFIGPSPEGREVNHIDGVKSHCWVENLEYLTRSENNKHAYRIGLRTVSEKQRALLANGRRKANQLRRAAAA